MRMLDIFSGIGGFSLAAQWCWGDDLEIEAFVEIDEFCCKVLKKNWPGVPIYGDVKKIQWLVAESKYLNGRIVSRERVYPRRGISTSEEPKDISGKGVIKIRPIDLLTGGFPCQPFSCAGKRAGTEDDRYIWPEMLRAIHEVKPRWIVAENVPGLLTLQDGMVFERVCVDLENEGYEVIPVIIPACAQGAPHRRDRVWIVAKNSINGGNRRGSDGDSGRGECSLQVEGSDCHAPDTDRFNGDDAGHGSGEVSQFEETEISRCDSADSARELLNGRRNAGTGRWGEYPNSYWQEHWYEVATRLCRVDDGVPSRVDRLKCLGNSIVPQVAYQIFKAIKEMNYALSRVTR